MTRTLALVCMASVMWMWQGDKGSFNPVGRWTYSTQNEEGNPATGSIEVTGKAGAYSGKIVTSQGRELPITDVATSRDAAVLFADLPEGGSSVIKIARLPNGTYSGSWAAMRTLITAKIERATQP